MSRMNVMKSFNQKLKICRRDKVLLIVRTNDDRLLFVQDVRTSEWGYITGGCKGNSTPFEDAIREFEEETNNCLHLERHRFRYLKTFTTLFRPTELLIQDKKEKKQIRSYYHVFCIKLSKDEETALLTNYTIRGVNKETKNIVFKKNNDSFFNEKNVIWNFMKQVVFKCI